MNNHDYEQKKRECWESVKFALRAPNTDRKVFESIFDRAYALGMEAKDAEGEEMLTVPRSKAQELYAEAQKAVPTCEHDRGFRNAELTILRNLFSSKCLPDDTVSDCHRLQEPKPAEPRFNVGDKVCYRPSGEVYEVEGKTGRQHYALKGWLTDVVESDLEPYHDPIVKEAKENAKTFAFDRIVKDGFSKERRLNIAAMITAGIYSNDKAASRFNSIEALVRKALDITDTLIAECEQTDNLNRK